LPGILICFSFLTSRLTRFYLGNAHA
jgi:hypothetical protein